MPRGDHLASAGDNGLRQSHFRDDEVHERRAVLERPDIPHRITHGLLRPVPLPGGDGLSGDIHLLQSADGHQRLLHPVLQPFHEGGLRDKAAHAKDDAEHRQRGAKLVGPDLLEADADGVEEVHCVSWAPTALDRGRENREVAPAPASRSSTWTAILPSRISMRRGVKAAISGSCVTRAIVRPSWLRR